MRSNYLAALCAACLVSQAKAIKTKQDNWWDGDDVTYPEDSSYANELSMPDSGDWWTSGDLSAQIDEAYYELTAQDRVDHEELFLVADKACAADVDSCPFHRFQAIQEVAKSEDDYNVVKALQDQLLLAQDSSMELIGEEPSMELVSDEEPSEDCALEPLEQFESPQESAIKLGTAEEDDLFCEFDLQEPLQQAQESAIQLAIEEAEELEAEYEASMDAAAADVAYFKATQEVARISEEQAAQMQAQEQAAQEAAKLEAERFAAEQRTRIANELMAAEQAELYEQSRLAAEAAARIERERLAIEKQTKLLAEHAKLMEEKRLAAEEEARVEKERHAAEEAARLEQERLAQAEADRLEAERIAAEEEAARQAAEQVAQLEAQKIAAKEAARLEQERLAAEQEAHRLSYEAAAKQHLIELQEREAQAVAALYPKQVEASTDKPEPVMAVQAALDAAVVEVSSQVAEEVSDALPEEAEPITEAAAPVEAATELPSTQAEADEINLDTAQTDLTEVIEAADAALAAEAVAEEVIAEEATTEEATAEEPAAENADSEEADAEKPTATSNGEAVGTEEPVAEEDTTPAIQVNESEEITSDSESLKEIMDELEAEITPALYEKTEKKITELLQKEESIIAKEILLDEIVMFSIYDKEIKAAEERITKLEDIYDALEMEIVEIYDIEQEIKATLTVAQVAKVDCKSTADQYDSSIKTITTQKEEIVAMTNAMAESLAEYHPNTESSAQAKAVMRKMYKLSGYKSLEFTPFMPPTPMECVISVAGKVLLLESLAQDLSAATAFRDYFADVYCAAYKNSLVVINTGVDQTYLGGLDKSIEKELQRVFGPFEQEQIDEMTSTEITAIATYISAVESGDFEKVSSELKVVTPMAAALDLCELSVVEEISLARQVREDYLFDGNFLRYLRSL